MCGVAAVMAVDPVIPDEIAATETDSTIHIGEVAVTAIKQGLDLRLQPVAATIVGRSETERLGIASMKDVSEIAPNFYIPAYGTRMTSSIYVRGLGARIDQPVVGLNVDNVPFLNKDSYDFDLLDIERIEVIRGPQSTLYGRNTMGGQINIYTLSPLNYSGSRVMASAASGPQLKLGVSHYSRLAPRLAMGISGYFNYSDGFFTNEATGYKADREKSGSLRWRTEWLPAPRLKLSNVASLSLSHQGGYPYCWAQTGSIAYNDTCYYRRTGFSDGLTIGYDGGSWTLSSITSLQYIDDKMGLDQDFRTVDYFTLVQKRREWTVTQDFVARSRKGGRYEWLAGLFGFSRNTTMDAPVTFKADGIDSLIIRHRNEMNPQYPLRWDEEQFVLGSHFSYPVYGLAAYHQSTVRLDRWTLSAALRLDYEHAGLNYRSRANTSYTILDATNPDAEPTVFDRRRIDIDDRGRLSQHFLELLPKVTASFRLPMPSPSEVYLSVGKGYKSGGYNTQMFSDVLQQRIMGMMGMAEKYDVDDIVRYRPEKSWNYEAGAHITCADGVWAATSPRSSLTYATSSSPCSPKAPPPGVSPPMRVARAPGDSRRRFVTIPLRAGLSLLHTGSPMPASARSGTGDRISVATACPMRPPTRFSPPPHSALRWGVGSICSPPTSTAVGWAGSTGMRRISHASRSTLS